MFSWYWIPVFVITGFTAGIFVIALCTAVKRGDGTLDY